jgi:misacylated tRNA(Ala) deacylase
MTDLLFHNDSYLKEFNAIITEANYEGLVLDRTAFYIGGGGQPSDTGVLISDVKTYKVTKVSRSGANVYTISKVTFLT